MRVITGTARGRRLKTLDGDDVIRPTTDKVKEGIFSAIQFDIEGRCVLDLFAGSGQLGIEALSRGARRCVFVDSSRLSCKVAGENISACGFEGCSQLVQSDAKAYLLRCSDRFDIAFLDPPYDSGLLGGVLEQVTGVMNTGGVIICETRRELPLAERVGCFTLRRTYNYGATSVGLYRHESVEG